MPRKPSLGSSVNSTATPFEKAHQSLSVYLEKRRAKGVKRNQDILNRGKDLLNNILQAVQAPTSISFSAYQQFLAFIDEVEEISTTPSTSSFVATYLLEVGNLILDQLMLPAIESLNMGVASVSADCKDETPQGDAERIARMLEVLVESAAKSIEPDAQYVCKELHSHEWLLLLRRTLVAFQGGRVGGADASTTVSSVLEMIVMDTKNKEGLNAMMKNRTDWAVAFRDLIAVSSVGLLTLHLFRVISVVGRALDSTNRHQFLHAIFDGKWPASVFGAIVQTLEDDRSSDHYKPLHFFNLINAIADDDSVSRARGFQITKVEVDGEDLIQGDRAQRRLKKGEVILYLDQWVVVANLYLHSGVEEPSEFALNRIEDFTRHTTIGDFTFRISPTECNAPTRTVSLGINADQADDFHQTMVKQLAHVSSIKQSGASGAAIPAVNDQGAEDAFLDSQTVKLLEEAEALFSDETAMRSPTAQLSPISGEVPLPPIESEEENESDTAPMNGIKGKTAVPKQNTSVAFRPPKAAASKGSAKLIVNKKLKSKDTAAASDKSKTPPVSDVPTSPSSETQPAPVSRPSRASAKMAMDKTKQIALDELGASQLEVPSDHPRSSVAPETSIPSSPPQVVSPISITQTKKTSSSTTRRSKSSAMRGKEDSPVKKPQFRTPAQKPIAPLPLAPTPKKQRVNIETPLASPYNEVDESPLSKPMKGSDQEIKTGANRTEKATVPPQPKRSVVVSKPAPNQKTQLARPGRVIDEPAKTSLLPWETDAQAPQPNIGAFEGHTTKKGKGRKVPQKPEVSDVFSDITESAPDDGVGEDDITLVPESDLVDSSPPLKVSKVESRNAGRVSRIPQVMRPAKTITDIPESSTSLQDDSPLKNQSATIIPSNSKKMTTSDTVLPSIDHHQLAQADDSKAAKRKAKKSSVVTHAPPVSPIPGVTEVPQSTSDLSDPAPLAASHPVRLDSTGATGIEKSAKTSKLVNPSVDEIDFQSEPSFERGIAAMSTPKVQATEHRTPIISAPSKRSSGYASERDRPVKRLRFSNSPGPRNEIDELLLRATDVIQKLTNKRIQNPGKQVLATQRRLEAATMATAEKWAKESQLHLDAVIDSQKAVLGSYNKLSMAAKQLAAESVTRDQKVQYVLKKARKNAEMPATLF